MNDADKSLYQYRTSYTRKGALYHFSISVLSQMRYFGLYSRLQQPGCYPNWSVTADGPARSLEPLERAGMQKYTSRVPTMPPATLQEFPWG